uniref:C-type lectin domain-containing protein n=1 Tax=Gouania willdenowi TaxID=441366 RepID=A0A8C5E6B8_GOUWI
IAKFGKINLKFYVVGIFRTNGDGVCFSTGWSYSTCLQYHYVADQKTWTEAQTYCRQTYADLATIGNKEQNDQLLDTITSAGQSSAVWMGLYSTIDWRWSDGFSGVGANYRNWRSDQPDFYSANGLCVAVRNVWSDELCSSKRHPTPLLPEPRSPKCQKLDYG